MCFMRAQLTILYDIYCLMLFVFRILSSERIFKVSPSTWLALGLCLDLPAAGVSVAKISLT